jgi:hypothetical protein
MNSDALNDRYYQSGRAAAARGEGPTTSRPAVNVFNLPSTEDEKNEGKGHFDEGYADKKREMEDDD